MRRAMLALLNRILDISLLRAGPQVLPRSVSWTAIAAMVYVIGYVVQLRATGSPQHAMELALLDAIMTAVIAVALLRWRGMPERILQTLFAFYGTGCVLLLVSTPLARWALDENTGEPVKSLSVAGLFVILFWGLAIVAHIYRNALDVRFVVGLFIAISYFIVWFQLQSALFPGTP